MSQFSSNNQDVNQATVERHNKNSYAITLAFSITAFAGTLFLAYFAYTEKSFILFLPAALLLLTVFVNFYPLSLIRTGHSDQAMITVILVFLFDVFVLETFVQGLGLLISITTILLVLFIAGLAMSAKYAILGTVVSFLAGAATFLLDILLTTNRVQIPLLVSSAPFIASGLIIPIVFIFIREFKNFNLQIKTTLGILITGGIVVATIAYFTWTRASNIINSISTRYENSVTEQTKEQILNTTKSQASEVDLLFANIQNDLINLAKYRISLEAQQNSIAENSYWNAEQKIFQLPTGQFGNSSRDVGAVFIPNTIEITDVLFSDLNTSMYLDFVVPDVLASHSEAAAVYYISEAGYTIYYPNNSLAQALPPDFDPRTEIFFSIASPEKNPNHLPRITDPYQDPAGEGVIVTLSVPIYTQRGVFKGVIGADVKISSIVEKVSALQLGANDFSFLVDKNGFIIYMPEQGYQLFDIEKRDVGNILTRESIFDTKIPVLEFAAQRIIFNQANLVEISVNGINTYVASTTLPTTDYKLVFFAPADELNVTILNSRQEIQNDIQSALQNASVILIGLFISSLIISLVIGQIITRPVRRLTDTVKKIAGGDLHARAQIESQDEAGLLARSFNDMAERLNDTLQGLEEKVAERTQELEIVSRSNEYRAKQFESIARISSIISTAQSLEGLLPQIAETISEELHYYHIGIFLLDVQKEYAILAAANSEGGRKMLERNHRLRVGETGIVGYVTRSGQARLALDVGADAVFFNNPDLPETRSEIALPLHSGAEIIGALDVQSVETNAFSEEDVNILTVLAEQVSIAIQNARLFQQSREALEQAELSAAQMIEQQWKHFLGKQNINQYYFDGIEAKPAVSADKQNHNLAIPLILRGAQIGVLRLTATEPERKWDEDEIAIAQATAERAALAIENARLLQEAQKRATKERTIGEISAKIGNLIGVEKILETTLHELGNTLPNTDVAIQFSESPEEE